MFWQRIAELNREEKKDVDVTDLIGVELMCMIKSCIFKALCLVWSWLLNHKASKLYNLHMNRAALLASQSDQRC